ncbi:hypothetical protein ABPG72_005347 [Tetrahymena utriculariae]
MKNIPENMKNILYPTQNEDLIKIEKGLNVNQCQQIYEDVYKLTKTDNSFQFTGHALPQLNNQCLSNTIEQNEDKLFTNCLVDEKIQIYEDTNKKFVTKSSVSTSQNCLSRKKQSSDYDSRKMKRIMYQTILFFRPHMLSQWQLKIINDVVSDFTIQQSSIQTSTRNQKYKRIIKRYNTYFMKQSLKHGDIFGIEDFFGEVNEKKFSYKSKYSSSMFYLTYEIIQSRIQFSELELDQQEDKIFHANCSQKGYKDFQLNNNQHINEEQVQQSQASSIVLILRKQKLIQSPTKINNKEPYENAQLQFYNSQNIIKTLDIDADMRVKNQIKSNSALQNDFTTFYEKSQILIQSQFSRQKSQQQFEMQNSQNSSNVYYSSQQNINSNSNSYALLKLPLGKSIPNQKPQKEKSKNVEKVISLGNIPYCKTQTFKSQSIQDYGCLGLFYQATQQNYTELKEMMYTIKNYFQHQEMLGSIKKQKKTFGFKQRTNWVINPQLIGDLDLDYLHDYKTYFPNYKVDKVIKKMKVKLAIDHIKINLYSLHQSVSLKNQQKSFLNDIIQVK